MRVMTLTNSSDSKSWTYEDVCALPADGNRYEVINGELIVSPSPATLHQKISGRLHHFFYGLELTGLGSVFCAPMDVIMPGCAPVEPDLLFLLPEQLGQIQKNFIDGAPHLIVEILSPSTARTDRVKKARIYAANSVQYYLLADPDAQTLEVLHLDGSHYQVVASLEPGDTWEFLGASLDIRALFAELIVTQS